MRVRAAPSAYVDSPRQKLDDPIDRGPHPPMALFTIGFLAGIAAMFTTLYVAHHLSQIEG